MDGKFARLSADPLKVSGISVWYMNPRFCIEYHRYMLVEQSWRESQDTRSTLANGMTLSSKTYVGIEIYPMTGKTQSSEDGLVFPTS